jgi:two-component system, OmpR family, sensor kinase
MFDSIRTKLTLWYAGVLAFLIIVFALITYISVERILSQETDKNLLELSKNFTFAVISEVSGETDEPSEQDAVTEIIKEFKFQNTHIFVLSTDGKVIAKTSELSFPTDFPDNSYATFELNNQKIRVFSTGLKLPANNYKLLIYNNLSERIEIRKRFAELFAIIVPIVLLFAIFPGYWLAKRSLKPVSEMSRQAIMISANNLHSRLLVKNERDEIGSLANVINELLERLENSFEQQRRFMADASHELRTPLAIVRGESEVALSKEDRPVADLRESLAIVNDESKRLTKIVEDLFTLSRADAGQFKTNFKQLYLDEILADCVRNLRVLANEKRVSLEIKTEETLISGDEQLLRRLFINLLDNAVKFNRETGKVLVKLENNVVTIEDTGCGIAEKEQSKIFERFYRTDKARSRHEETQTSGAGLGLSIAKWIAEIHHAELRLVKSDESGSIFSISFPC